MYIGNYESLEAKNQAIDRIGSDRIGGIMIRKWTKRK